MSYYDQYIYQLLQQYLPRITAALESIASVIPDFQSYMSSALSFAQQNMFYLLGLLFLAVLGYIFGRRNLL